MRLGRRLLAAAGMGELGEGGAPSLSQGFGSCWELLNNKLTLFDDEYKRWDDKYKLLVY